jgi:HlyD family secretion protein
MNHRLNGVCVFITILIVTLMISQSPVCVKAADVEEVIKVTGTLEPIAAVDISSQVSGTLIKFGEDPNASGKTIDYGTAVKKGTVLAEIDPTAYQFMLDRAKASVDKAEASVRLATAQIELAKVDVERAEKHAADTAATDLGVEHAKSVLNMAEAELVDKKAELALQKTGLDLAQLNVTNCTIKSPIDGVIVDRHCEVGQTIATRADAQKMFLIAEDLKKMQLWLSVNDRDIGRVAVNQPVRFSVLAFPNERFTGKVAQIRLKPQSNQNKVSYTVVANLDSVDKRLLPYLIADAEIVISKQLANH